MLLVVETRYGITQINSSGRDITIADLSEALEYARKKQYECDIVVWDGPDMYTRLYDTANTKVDSKILDISDIQYLFEFLANPTKYKNENIEEVEWE